ncbi:MAG: S41 family peptidase [Lachnospiraceae bacterium]
MEEQKELAADGEDQTQEESKRGAFWRGVIGGMILTLFLVFTALVVITAVQRKKGNAIVSDGLFLTEETEKKVDALSAIIDQYYYEDPKEEDLINGMYKGLFEGLDDPYSVYYTEEEYKSLKESNEGTYQGIGVVLTQDKKTNAVTVLRAYEDSPAEKAGIKNGDVVISVDDLTAESMDLSKLVAHIRGKSDGSIHMVVSRKGEKEHLEFDVECSSIKVPTVTSQMLDDQIGYLQITEFTQVTAEQFEEQIDDLNKRGMKAMIVDLRDNPGGLVNSVVEILDDILPEGTVVYTMDKAGERNDYTSDEKKQMHLPITVLINENSASASEIFAGAIRDFKYGTLIGKKTFGKGIVQTILPLDDGSAVKITTAKYYTPNGDYIHKVGIKPDISLEYEYTGDEEKAYDIEYDNQVQKACEVLKEQLN